MRRAIVLAGMVLITAFPPPASAGSGATVPLASPPQSDYRFAGTQDHVRVVSVARDAEDRDKITVTLVIDPGYHINANPASSKNLIPTTLTFDGYDLKQIIYPKPYRFKPKFAEEAIEVYQGTERIVALFPNGSLEPDTRLRGTLSAQACTEEICLPPAEIPFSN
jgi:hypothetical protein